MNPRTKDENPLRDAMRVQRTLRRRVLILKVALLISFLFVAWRLVQVQIVEAPKFQEIARRQYEARMSLPAAKGNIYDRNGNTLVSNSMFISFAADPKILGQDARRAAEEFSRVFGKPKKFYLDRLRSDKRFVWLERCIPPDIAKKLSAEKFEGIVSLQEPKRLYHYDHLAGQLVGFTDIDNKGLSGIELQFDKQMCGTEGYVVLQRDGLGNRKPSVEYPRVDPIPGASLYLTLDLATQSIVEEELQRGIRKCDADAGVAAAIDPRTGEILAFAQYPGVDPGEAGRYPSQDQKLRVVTDMFEPGSIFKVVTVSAALEAGLVRPDQAFFADNGEYKVPLRNGKFRVIRDTHEYGWMTFQEAMELSSNIVMAKVSDIIGGERLYRKAKEFGFGSLTGIEVPGEIRGELRKPSTWSATTLNTMAYGYEVGVTPMQILVAYSAVANGGVLLKPYLVKKIVAASGDLKGEGKPQIVRRVISEEVAHTLTRFLEGVVERGTGTLAKIEGMRIAGKTGTSKKQIAGRYEPGHYTASFVGFFPVESPQIVCLVMVDNPRTGSYFGGQVAAPIFRSIAERLRSSVLHLPQVSRESAIARADSTPRETVPDVRTRKVDAARRALGQRGLRYVIEGTGDIVLQQSPEPGTKLQTGETVTLFLSPQERPHADGYVETPDLRGLTIRQAMNRLAIERMHAIVKGSGIVIGQSPSAGERVKIGTRVVITCEPKKFSVATIR
jgi:cell division protein FtsI (penicillin-binding protein 3)